MMMPIRTHKEQSGKVSKNEEEEEEEEWQKGGPAGSARREKEVP